MTHRHFAAALLAAATLIGNATAATVSAPEKATELLARAWMIDSRCKVLTSDDRDRLSGLVADAEISLAKKLGVQAARTAMSRGRASGADTACGESAAQSVNDIFNAAKTATAALDALPAVSTEQPEPQAAPAVEPAMAEAQDTAVEPQPVDVAPASVPVVKTVPAKIKAAPAMKFERKPKVQVSDAKPVRVLPKVSAAPKANPAVVSNYSKTAEAYFVELRCRTMSYRAVNAFYGRVLAQHRQAVAAGGRAAVRAMLQQAQARAARRSC
ncbi:MAG: hypothetical protein U1E15_02660 [Hyphomicrobiales bacterium]